MKVGAIIRKFRAKKKISIRELCTKTNGKISTRTLKAIESDSEKSNPTLKTLLAIREAFGIKTHSLWMKHYLEDPLVLYRTHINALKTTPFVITPTSRTLSRIVDVTDPKVYAVEVNGSVGIDWAKAGWIFFVNPSAEVKEGDLVLNLNPDGGAHMHEERSQLYLKHLKGKSKKSFLANRKKMRVEKIVMIKPK